MSRSAVIKDCSCGSSRENSQPQNANRKANCMKRGVVIVPRYLPNCAAP